MAADLLAQLRAALDDDERVARAATPGPWAYDGNPSATVVGGPERRSLAAAAYGWPDPECAANAQHIARHDPARVLRWVAAAREVLERHEPLPAGDGWVCGDRGELNQPWPCPDVRALAGAYGIGEG